MASLPHSPSRAFSWKTRSVTGVNAAGLLVAVGYTAAGAARNTRRGSSDDRPQDEVELWAWQSAVRTLAYVVPLAWSYLRSGTVTPELLIAAGLAQVGDSAIGWRRRDPRMALAPAAMAAVHFATARAATRRSSSS